MSHLQTCWHSTQTSWSPCATTLAYTRAMGHDPAHMHLGIWDVAADAAPPERAVLLSQGHDPRWVLPAELAGGSFAVKPTRKYGRRFYVQSDDVAIPGLLDRSPAEPPPHGSGLALLRRERARETDLGTLCAALMRGLVYKRQEGKPARVVTLGSRVQPCNPWSQVYPLLDKLNALDAWARGFSRERRVPILLAELIGEAAYEEATIESGVYAGRSYTSLKGHRIARVASILATDAVLGNEFAMLARFNLS